MKKRLPKRKMIRYCLSDIAKGLFNGMIGNYLLYFFQPTVKSGIPSLLPQNKLLGFLTVMALLTGLGKVVDAAYTEIGVAKYAVLEPAADISGMEQVFILTEFDAG